MASTLQRYEVRVLVPEKGNEHYSYKLKEFVRRTEVRTFHSPFFRDHSQAFEWAKKYGRPISARKVSRDRVCLDTEKMMQRIREEELRIHENPYPNAIAMDEMIWNKKVKRSERLQDREKDKPSE